MHVCTPIFFILTLKITILLPVDERTIDGLEICLFSVYSHGDKIFEIEVSNKGVITLPVKTYSTEHIPKK